MRITTISYGTKALLRCPFVTDKSVNVGTQLCTECRHYNVRDASDDYVDCKMIDDILKFINQIKYDKNAIVSVDKLPDDKNKSILDII